MTVKLTVKIFVSDGVLSSAPSCYGKGYFVWKEQGAVSGVQTTTSANAAAQNPGAANENPYNFLNALDRLNALQTVSAASPTWSSSGSDDAARAVTIPVVAAMVVGGGLALVSTDVTVTATGMSSNPFSNPIQLVEQLQPVYSQINMENIIPMINLMVAAPIYYRSLEEAVSNIKERERNSHVETAQNFAKDVIKMVSDPAFVMVSFVNKMAGAEQMSPELKERVASMLKLILASVALSLLYSVEVGKVQDGKFWGMEAQEFRDVLNGTVALPDPTKQPSTQNQLMATLLNQVSAQLNILSADDSQKAQTIEAILNYIGQSHDLNHMLDPVDVFKQVLTSVDPTKDLEIQPT